MLLNNIRIAAVSLLFAVIPVFPVHAGFFSSRFDDFKELVETGKVEEAAVLYAKEQAYFSDLKGSKRKFVEDTLGERDRRYRTELNVARIRLALAEREDGQILRWKKLKESLPETQTVLAKVQMLPARGPLTTEGIASLVDASSRITQALESEAPQALLDYGLFSQPSFTEQYPVRIRWAERQDLAGSVEAQLRKADARRLESCRKMYGDELIAALGLTGKFSNLYLAARLRESGARSYLAKQRVRERVEKGGWTPSRTAGNGVLLAVWPVPQGEGSTFQAALPSTVDYTLLDAEKTPDQFIASGGVGGHDLVVFLRPGRVQLERSESNSRQVSSQYQSGTRQVQNPGYGQAVRALNAAEQSLANVRRAAANASSDNNSTLGMLSAVIGGVSEAAAESDVSDARRTLANTPRMVEEAVLSSYSYPAKTVAVKQSVTLHYAVYDAGTGKVSTGSTDRRWEKSFEVVDQMRAEDPSRADVMKNAKTPQYVEDWVKAPVKSQYEAIWKAIASEYNKANWGL